MDRYIGREKEKQGESRDGVKFKAPKTLNTGFPYTNNSKALSFLSYPLCLLFFNNVLNALLLSSTPLSPLKVSSMEFYLENPLTDSDDLYSDSVASLFLVESDHMPSENYFSSLQAGDFDVLVRREAISSISQFSCNFDPLLSYLAVNYLDRFLSSHGMLQPSQWVIKLLSISCVSLAAKMKKTQFSLTDFQGDGGIIFDTQTIGRMEALILGALKWRMRSITPFSFIPFFISLFKLQDPPLWQALRARAIDIIFKSQNDINFLVYKPSILAASALLCASHELFPLQYPCLRKSLSNSSYVNKENMSQCYNAMQTVLLEEHETSSYDVASSSVTPVNVLDPRFSSSESGNYDIINNIGNGTTTATLRLEGDQIKRRKISHCYDNQTVQVSQIGQF